MKDLFIRLRENGMECVLFDKYTGYVFYANDTILLSALLNQLQMMLNICTSYAVDNDLLFNNLNSYCTLYGQHANLN